MKVINSFHKPLAEEDTVEPIKYDAIEDVEDYFRINALARVSILPRWIIF